MIRTLLSAVIFGFAAFRLYQVVAAASAADGGPGGPGGGFWATVSWAALHLALPLHLLFVVMLLQRRFATPRLARYIWFGTVISGCWLAVSFVIRRLL